MSTMRLVLVLSLVVVGTIAATTLLAMQSLADRAEGAVRYKQAREELDGVIEHHRLLEQRVVSLQTSVDSVELGARIEYRLIKPGERLYIVEWSNGAPEAPRRSDPWMTIAQAERH